MRRQAVAAACAALALALGACCPRCGGEQRSDGAPPGTRTKAPRVTPGAEGLVFTWIDPGGEYRTATKVEDIPPECRRLVRVQDPALPPLEPSKLWVVDLSCPDAGSYEPRLVDRCDFEPQRPEAGPSRADAAGTGEGRPAVVMYMSSTCPVCRRARGWLAERGVGFVERDVVRDEAAAAELEQKAARLGLRTQGVPVFDVGGRLINGFDEQALSQALGLDR